VALLALLSDTGSVRLNRRGAFLRAHVDDAEAVAAAFAHVEDRQRVEQSRIEMLRGYAETRRCRRQVLLGYFGQELEDPCGNCDTCAEGSAMRAPEEDPGTESGYRVDDRVRHREWGDGTVMDVEDDRMTVFFESAGYRVLALELVEDEGLVEHVG
jgi:ATP-dependent DNA helicase RecQ